MGHGTNDTAGAGARLRGCVAAIFVGLRAPGLRTAAGGAAGLVWPLVRSVILAGGALLLVSCAAKGGAPDAGRADVASEMARGRALLAGGAGAPELPARAEVLALAQSIEAHGVREGAGARAVELHALAAALLERVWRTEGRAQDATEAIDLYRAAAHDVAIPGACEAAVRGAKLSGEVAGDAATTYAELYRAERRFSRPADGGAPAGACPAEIEAALIALSSFRPPARVLEAIDEGLLGEGAMAPASASGTRPNVKVSSAAPQIVRIENWPGEESARIVVVLDRAAAFRAVDQGASGGKTGATFLELDGVDVGNAARSTPLAGVVTRVRADATTTGARVSLDLAGPAYRRIFHLLEPYRVIIDIARHPPGSGPSHGTQRTASRVVLDPGHGGSDPGAIGPTGVREKDVTLDIAHRVAPILAKQGIQVVLTRDDDRFVPLEERTQRANGFNADLFISIHCNAAETRSRRGVETYVLDTTKDEIAGRVAARENATSQAANAELGSILASMRMADQSTRSSKLAELLQKASMASLKVQYSDASDGGVKTAGFYVLVGARMPGVLFETSYISNAIEEERLASVDYKQRLADGIANAVRAYQQGR